MAPSTPSSRSWQRRPQHNPEAAIVKAPFLCCTQRAFRQALLADVYTPNEQVASLAEFLDGLRESLGAILRDLIAEDNGLKLGL